LVKLQAWVKHTGARIVVVFEGRDAAGKGGIILIKYWVSVSNDEQRRRFRARIEDPLRQWKLSPTDLESVRRWYDYSIARDAIFMATDTEFAPWYVVRSDDKRRARLNCIRHLLSYIPYEEVPYERVKIPERDMTNEYDDSATLAERRFIPEHY
jgi:polyphosphate kinase 2 (PPK2 family)